MEGVLFVCPFPDGAQYSYDNRKRVYSLPLDSWLRARLNACIGPGSDLELLSRLSGGDQRQRQNFDFEATSLVRLTSDGCHFFDTDSVRRPLHRESEVQRLYYDTTQLADAYEAKVTAVRKLSNPVLVEHRKSTRTDDQFMRKAYLANRLFSPFWGDFNPGQLQLMPVSSSNDDGGLDLDLDLDVACDVEQDDDDLDLDANADIAVESHEQADPKTKNVNPKINYNRNENQTNRFQNKK